MTIDLRFSQLLRVAGTSLLALAISACGGSDDAAPAAGVTATIDAAGGTIDGPGGVRLVVPAGALTKATALTIAQSAAGAPVLPASSVGVSATFALTPHGTTFAVPVTITVPFDASQLSPGETPTLWKTNATQDAWVPVPGAAVVGATVQAQISSFSWTIVPIALSRPTILVQPVAQSQVEPAAATFSVGATGPTLSGILGFQWKRNGTAIVGATSASYTTGPTSVAADDGALFSVDVTNLAGTVTSRDAMLTVTPAIVAAAIGQPPADVGIAVGASAVFSVVAIGTAPTYQWQRSNDGGTTFTDIVGAINASFTLVNAQLADSAARFRVRVANAAATVFSSAALLTVSAAPPLAGAAVIAAGDDFSLAVDAAGIPYSWGSDATTALGNGAQTGNTSVAAPLALLTGVRAVSAGNAGVAVKNDGTAWAFGYKGYIDCGFGSVAETPEQIAGAANIVAASVGANHTLLLDRNGVVHAIGCNDQGQLGRPIGPVPLGSPAAPVQGLPGPPRRIVAIAAGLGYSLAVDDLGFVWSWGAAGARGDAQDTSAPPRATPMQVNGVSSVVAVAAGAHHVLALRSNGFVAAWGNNDSGQLGDGTNVDQRFPISTLLTSGVTAVAAGGGTSLAVRADGSVMSWGLNTYGQLGTGTSLPFNRSTPAPVTGIASAVSVAVGIGRTHSLALLSDGTLRAWGNNGAGQLGDGTQADRFTPVPVTGLDLH